MLPVARWVPAGVCRPGPNVGATMVFIEQINTSPKATVSRVLAGR